MAGDGDTGGVGGGGGGDGGGRGGAGGGGDGGGGDSASGRCHATTSNAELTVIEWADMVLLITTDTVPPGAEAIKLASTGTLSAPRKLES